MAAVCDECGIQISEDEYNLEDHKDFVHRGNIIMSPRDSKTDKDADLYTTVPDV